MFVTSLVPGTATVSEGRNNQAEDRRVSADTKTEDEHRGDGKSWRLKK